MKTLLQGAYIHLREGVKQGDIAIDGDVILGISDHYDATEFEHVKTLLGYHLFPGLIDVHTHLREPGFFYKETIKTGTLAAAHGGFTSILTMPNVQPAPDSLAHLNEQMALIKRDAVINVYPLGAITRGRKGNGALSDMAALAPFVKGFSDDGTGVQTQALMEQAMQEAKKQARIIVAHCEDEKELKPGAAVNEGIYSERFGLVGINNKSEYGQLQRDIALLRQTGAAYHMCHLSTQQSVNEVRQAKEQGLDITCETALHYLLLTDADLKDEGAYKMNPPLRSREDRAALIEGILDGTIDMLASDHAPHSDAEKAKGLAGSAMGIVGLETSFQMGYTYLVRKGIITFEKLLELMVYHPADRFDIPSGIVPGQKANLTVWDLDKVSKVDANTFLSKGRATPFNGMKVFGECVLTIANGHTAYEREASKC